MNNNNYKSVEPRQNNLFSVEFPDEFNGLNFSVSKINKPKLINNKWQDIEIEFMDFIDPIVSYELYKIAEYSLNNVMFDFKINTFNSSMELVEQWNIYIDKIIFIDFGKIWDYTNCLINAEIQRPRLCISPSNCVLNKILY